MGLNFGMVLGAMAGQIGLIFVTDWPVRRLRDGPRSVDRDPDSGRPRYICGAVLNKAKGREMVTSYILGFFVNGVYQLIVLYTMGKLIPISNPQLVLSRDGIRNAINLTGVRHALDNLIPFRISGIDVPLRDIHFHRDVLPLHRLVQEDEDRTGHEGARAGHEGCRRGRHPVERTRIIAILISTILACYGQIIFLQNIGTMNTYNSHEQAGMFAIAAILIGGASVSRATITNVFVGVILFHLMFVVSRWR